MSLASRKVQTSKDAATTFTLGAEGYVLLRTLPFQVLTEPDSYSVSVSACTWRITPWYDISHYTVSSRFTKFPMFQISNTLNLLWAFHLREPVDPATKQVIRVDINNYSEVT